MNPNKKTDRMEGFILKISKKMIPTNEVNNRKLKYPAGINKAKSLRGFNAGISSFQNAEKIEA